MKRNYLFLGLTVVALTLFFAVKSWMMPSQRPLTDRDISLQYMVQKQLPTNFADYITLCLHYKCWAYRADMTIHSHAGWGEREFCTAAVQAMRTLYHALENSRANKYLYYDPSNLYLYETFLWDEGSNLMMFNRDGYFKLVKEQKFLTEEEREIYKDQLGTDPKFYQGDNHIVIWKKPFEQVLKEFNLECPEIKRNPQEVLNFSDDPAIREAILTVRKRIIKTLEEQEGYHEYVSVPFAKLALCNKDGPYHWMFFIRKWLPALKSKNEKFIPYDPQAYTEEYRRLHALIVRMINEAPELKPYLKHPVNPRDVEFSFIWEQQLRKKEHYLGAHHHLIYRTHSHLVMEYERLGPNTAVKEDMESSQPLEEFFQSIGI